MMTDTFRSILEDKKAFGQSRHEAKKDGSDQDKIFSANTMKKYKSVADEFAKFIDERNPKVRHMRQAKKYANDFIQEQKDKGASAWTQQTYASALTKLFSEKVVTIEMDSKERANIKRSRTQTESSKHFSLKNNAELINFCQHTGLRRSELEHLKPNQLFEQDGQFYLRVKGKGGKIRNAMILNNDEMVIQRIKNTPTNQLVWGKVHSKAPIHHYRADYAQELYKMNERDLSEVAAKDTYRCRKDKKGIHYDKKSMLQTSKNLGHNRIDVIAENYLY